MVYNFHAYTLGCIYLSLAIYVLSVLVLSIAFDLILHQSYRKAFWKKLCSPQEYMLGLYMFCNCFFHSFITGVKRGQKEDVNAHLKAMASSAIVSNLHPKYIPSLKRGKPGHQEVCIISWYKHCTYFCTKSSFSPTTDQSGEKMRRKHRYVTTWQWLKKTTLKNWDNRRKFIFAFSKKCLSYLERQFQFFKAR